MGYVAPQIPQVQAPQFDFGDTLIAARKAEEAKNQQRAEMLLGQQKLAAEVDQNKAQNSFADRRTKIEEGRAKDEGDTHKAEVTQQVLQALDAGRPDLAHQIAKRYPGLLSSATTQAPAPPPAGGGDTLLPPSTETPNPNPIESPRISAEDSARAAIASTANQPDATADDLVAAREKADTARTDFDQANSQSMFTRAPDAQAPLPKTEYRVQGDVYDPTEALRATAAARQRNVETTKTAFGETGNPKYVNLAASLAASGVPPEKIAPIVSAEMEKDNARTAKDEDTKANRTFLQQEHVLNREQSDENNKRMTGAIVTAAGLRANPPAAQDTGARGDTSLVHRIVKDAATANGIPKLLQQRDAFNAATAQLEAQTGLGDADALTSMAKAFRGGVPNMFEDKRLQDHMTGLLGRIENIAAGAQSGRLGPEAEANVKQTLAAAKAEMERHVDGRYQTFAHGVGTNPQLQNYGGQVNAEVRTIFAPLGRDVPDVMAEDGAQAQPLGAAQGRAHGNPVQQAHAASKTKNAGRAAMVKDPAVQAAIAQLKAAPNDPRAPAVRAKLQAMGIDVQ